MLNDNDSLERLLFHVALYEDLMVEMTLSSGKVYVGWVLGGTAIRDRKYVEIMPVVSGYREKETRKVWFTTKYANVSGRGLGQSRRFSRRRPDLGDQQRQTIHHGRV